MKRFLSGMVATALMLALPSIASATDLAIWTFEVSLPTGTGSANGPWAAESGVNAGAGSPASGFHSNAASVWSNPAGNGSFESYSVNTWSANDYFQFSTSTIGYTSIAISWDQTRSSTGPADFTLLWSTDNVTYTPLLSYASLLNDVANGGTWSSGGPRIPNYLVGPAAGPAALDNQAVVYFRMRANVAGSAAAGSGRVDNVLITGIPEPTTLVLFGLAAVCCLRRR